MPQFIGKDDVKKFRNFVKRVYGIKSHVTRRKARELKPSQKEISRERIDDLIENENILKKVLVPLVISSDNYVVDGHHRWAAYRLKKPNKTLPVVEIGAPIKDVLGISIAWGAKHQDF
jgi:ParB-like chromosome segregation protein Spo0J